MGEENEGEEKNWKEGQEEVVESILPVEIRMQIALEVTPGL